MVKGAVQSAQESSKCVALERRGTHRTNQAKPREIGRRDDRKCHGCGKVGHLVAQCPRTKCFECGNEGHIARHCPYMYRRRETDQGEPMEVNAQRMRHRATRTRQEGSSGESTESSVASETEDENDGTETGGERKSGHGAWRRRSGERRTEAEI
nr:cellular nucleic acid-binding protein-like [Halyomorpha halys]